MFRRLAAALISMLSIGAAAPTSQPAGSIDQLIAQLGSDDYHARQAAADQLVDRGEAVRYQLAKLAADPSDADRRNLAAGILARLDRVARQGPTFITLHYQEANAQAVLADLASQAKVSLHFSPNVTRAGRLPTVTIDVDHQPFWLTLARLCKLTQTHVRSIESTPGIELTGSANNDPLGGPLCQAGPYLIAVISATRNSQIRYNDAAAVPIANDTLELDVFTDPRTRSIGLPVPTLVEAIDQNAHSLLPTAGHARFGYASVHGRWMRSFTCELAIRADSHTLKRLHGTIDATFAVESQTATIPDLQAGLHHALHIGQASLELAAFKVAGRDGSFTFSFSRTTPGSVSLAGLRLFDAANNVLYQGNGSTLITGVGAFVTSGSFSRPDAIKLPVSLVWTVPTRTETTHEPFAFEDLPLP